MDGALSRGLSDHLATNHPDIRVVWQDTGHMVVLSQPQPTADLIGQFIGDLAD